MAAADREAPLVYVLELTPVGDRAWLAVPVEVRLRRLLRAAARSYGMRVRMVKAKRRRTKRKVA